MRSLALKGVFFGLLGVTVSCSGTDAGDDGSSGGSSGDGDGDSSGDGDMMGDGDAAGDGDVTGDGDTTGDGDGASCSQTCAGCCDGETCVETPTDAQCGYSGGECSPCEAWQACGDDPDNFSSFGECLPLDSSTWTITVDAVTAYSQQEGPDDWDPLDGPDLFVCLEVDATVVDCTTSCTDSYSCSLNAAVGTVTWAEVADGSVYLQVWDEDASDHDYAGGVLLGVMDLENGGFVYTPPFQNVGFETISVEIEYP